MEANGKRKREDEAKRSAPQRAAIRRRVQQEELEEEFAATYHGLTAMYKYMEVRQLQNPLFLPRTLSYRSSAGDWTNDPSVRVKKKRGKSRAAVLGVGKVAEKSSNDGALAGAMLKDFKIGMTAQTVDTLKRANHQTGLVISAYSAQGERVKENEFTLVANCLIPGASLTLAML